MKVAIFAQSLNEDTKIYTQELIESLESYDVEIIIEKEYLTLMSSFGILDRDYRSYDQDFGLDKSVDLIFTLGGDGTILRVVSFVKNLEIPIVGINTGRLGFMATISKDEIKDRVKQIVNNNYKLKSRILLELETSDKVEGMPYHYALNEIAVNRKESTSMVTVDASLNGEVLNTYWGDGLIIATPTGSTGYSLSCGGPIIMPGSNNLVITPIAPHNLYARPFVIPDDTIIDLKISGRADSYLVSLDSRVVSVPEGIRLSVKKANFDVKMVRFHDERFLSTLRKKMLWGEDYRNEL